MSPLAIIRSVVAPRAAAMREVAMIPPYLRPGYRAPTAPTAAELMRKPAKWPLLWLTDIHGFDAVSSRSSGQASFSLTKPGGEGAGASFQCRVPLNEGELFGEKGTGTYLLIAIPATSEEQIEAIMRAAEAV